MFIVHRFSTELHFKTAELHFLIGKIKAETAHVHLQKIHNACMEQALCSKLMCLCEFVYIMSWNDRCMPLLKCSVCECKKRGVEADGKSIPTTGMSQQHVPRLP